MDLIENVGYEIVYADPPWPKKKGGIRKSRPNQSRELDYRTISLEEIKELLSLVKTADVHNFFVWTVDEFLYDTEKMMKGIGYKLHARIIWDKENGVAPAFTIRYAHEYLLWFYKPGKMLKPCNEMRGKYTTVLREKSTKHSKKPQVAYEMLEKMFPETRRLEMFARNTRKGWDSFGDEVEKMKGDWMSRNEL
ncbi:MT-A70 family methyltransferase [Streptococcus sanguinis]|uniref:MT-A70 family methyltransferase n=1 Tax=Streptococcus sanguinis TaxID=1305 RepID=UPI001D154E41|nr:MT-A70 family methyltransferase [Streptococcus sanguinis]MCC3167010.1 DNA methylase family protein [Streptococcus sanguinis]